MSWLGGTGGIVSEARLDFAGRFRCGQAGAYVDGFERDRWNVDEIYVTVQTAVEAEVAEVRGHAVLVAGVIAEDREGYACGLLRL